MRHPQWMVRYGSATLTVMSEAHDLHASVPADCELSAEELAELEARMAQRPRRDIEIGLWHAQRFGAPTLAHYRDVMAKSGRRWPGEAFIRRHHPVGDPV